MIEIEATESTSGQPNVHNMISPWYEADDSRYEEHGTCGKNKRTLSSTLWKLALNKTLLLLTLWRVTGLR